MSISSTLGRPTREGSYHLLSAARGDLLRRLGRTAEAIAAYRRALADVGSLPERRFLEARLRELAGEPVAR